MHICATTIQLLHKHQWSPLTTHDRRGNDIQGAPVKTIPLEKKICISANFRKLYASVHTTYRANFIETTYVVQQIQQFKL